MDIKHFFKNSGYISLVILACLNVTNSLAQTTTFGFGQGTINAYTTIPSMPNPSPFSNEIIQGTTTPFTAITFDQPFTSPPNVFTITPEAAGLDDPCTIRIDNVTTTGFQATCLEPITEDRASPAVSFEYIAIQDGLTQVPLVDGSGTVDFVSSCQNIPPSTQQFRPPFTFPSGMFSTAPTVITQVQTTNNGLFFPSPQGEPPFLDVRVLSVTPDEIDLRLETAEVGTFAVFQNEEICYLAVEENGCQELDFNTIDGSTAPIAFQALQTGNVVTGHDDGACVSVGFENGCFDSTPTVLAKQTTSNDTADGGWLRRCSASDNAATFIYDEDRVQDEERSHLNAEAISVFAFGEAAPAEVAPTQFQPFATFEIGTATAAAYLEM